MDTDLRLESSLWVGSTRHRAVLTGWYFKWTEVDKRNRDKKTISVPVAEVVGVELGRVEILPHKSVEEKDKDFTVFYVQRTSSGGSSGLLWRLCRTQFSCSSRVLRDQWTNHLNTAVKTHSPSRPRKLLVFINPFGGRQKGRQIFHSVVAPLFELAGISSHVIVTERANQARDHLLKKDLTGFDGVVCVGGDGMFSEILHGLIGRMQQESGLCESDPAVTLQPCPLHIGIIPAGSTNCVCYATVGVTDPLTSALHIIIGDSQPLDVCSVHYGASLVRYSVSLVGYGFYGDVLAESEKHRWMGPLRYDYSGAIVYLSNRSYTGVVQYLPADPLLSSPRDKTRCLSGCSVCSRSTERLFPHSDSGSLYSSNCSVFSTDSEGDWVSVEGRFRCVSLTCMSSSCPRSPQGLSPSAHLADGTGDLVLVWDTHPLGFLKFLHRHTSTQDQFELPFVEVHRVRAVRFSLPSSTKEEDAYEESAGPIAGMDEEDGAYVETVSRSGSQQRLAERKAERELGNEKKMASPFLCGMCCYKPPSVSVWNCDGEILPFTEILCRVHGQLVRLYARGIEDSTSIHSCREDSDKYERRGVLH